MYQSFHDFHREHAKDDSANMRETKIAILRARKNLVTKIKEHQLNQIDLKQDLNQHLLRLAMPQYDHYRKDNIDLLLKENVFLTFRINKINWNSLMAH